MTRVLNIVAHEDDDLLFINPDIIDDINAGNDSETLYITAGDASRGEDYWRSREKGMGVAYAQMAEAPGVSAPEMITMLDHQATRYTVQDHPNISLVFLHLTDPVDGPYLEGLRKLWEGEIDELPTIDGSPGYTKQQLIDVLHDRMADFQPDIIRTLDCTVPFNPDDHLTHTAAGYFASAAHQNYTQPHEFKAYLCYPSQTKTPNISGDGLAAKQSAYFAYDPYDTGKMCSDVATCSDPNLLAWMQRKYTTCHEMRRPVAFEVMEGDSGSLSHRNGDIGLAPTSIVFKDDLYVFYMDQSEGLRYAKAASPTHPNWNFGSVDGEGNVGQNPSAVVYDNKLHLFYYDLEGGDLRHASSANGTSWTLETLDGADDAVSAYSGDVGSASAATVHEGVLQVLYYDTGEGTLRHAWYDGVHWQFEVLEGTDDSTSGYASDIGLDPVVLSYQNALHAFYYDTGAEALRHAWSDTEGWHFEHLDGTEETDGRTTSAVGLNPAATAQGDSLQVFYRDEANGSLRHAWSDQDGWHFETLEGSLESVTRQDINAGVTPAVAAHGEALYVLAFAPNSGDLRLYSTSANHPWEVERLDGQGDDGDAGRTDATVGLDASLLICGTHAHAFYHDSDNGNLRHASWEI